MFLFGIADDLEMVEKIYTKNASYHFSDAIKIGQWDKEFSCDSLVWRIDIIQEQQASVFSNGTMVSEKRKVSRIHMHLTVRSNYLECQE